MSASKGSSVGRFARVAGMLFLASTVACGLVYAGGGFRGGAVGGVVVDVTGVLNNAEIDHRGALRAGRLEFATPVPAEMKNAAPLRMVSLRGLEAAIAERKQKGELPLRTDEMNLLGGLTRIRYVFVYPERNDIVLAGPGEGWKIDDSGNYVGATTGAPMLQLDHLLVALRTAESAAQNVISCSIDPTEEGMRRFQQYFKGVKTFTPGVIDGIEDALGKQTIKITGVPETSEFARIMIAADFRMKRFAMGLEQSPVTKMPSYIYKITSATAGAAPKSGTPRWWLAPNYDALLRDPEGLAWELRGPGVKCMTEDSLFSETGARQQTGKANPLAQQWADTMTAKYEELSKHEPVFGQLRNIMDMAVVAALIVKENLTEKASYSLPLLLSAGELATNELPAAKFVDTTASAIRKGNNWVITASGGVEITSWAVADKKEVGPAPAAARTKARADSADRWWW